MLELLSSLLGEKIVRLSDSGHIVGLPLARDANLALLFFQIVHSECIVVETCHRSDR